MLGDWLKKLAPLSQPISKKNNHEPAFHARLAMYFKFLAQYAGRVSLINLVKMAQLTASLSYICSSVG